MTPILHRSAPRGLAALRRLSEARQVEERCQLCAGAVAEQHQHLVDPEKRRLLCVCDACAILFDHAGVTRYRRVPRDARELAGFEVSDVLWHNLAIPIGLAFIFRSSLSQTIVAVYPSPAGPTETNIDEEVWNEVTALHRSLGQLLPDVEALLINRTRG